MIGYWYEILLGDKSISETKWQDFLLQIGRLMGQGRTWQLHVRVEQNILHYYLGAMRALPASIYQENFLLKPVSPPQDPNSRPGGLCFNRWDDNLATLQATLGAKSATIVGVDLTLRVLQQHIFSSASVIYQRREVYRRKVLAFSTPAQLLSVDFACSQNLAYKKFPKYFGIEKLAPLLTAQTSSTWLQPDLFPQLGAKQGLSLGAIDFAKHSLVLGGSGTGKSKFLAGLIQQIARTAPEHYQVVVIDPHAALQDDLCDIPGRTVVDFADGERSIDLFASQIEHVGAGVELMLGLFRELLGANYNSWLERVLRFSIYLLMSGEGFDFGKLRRLLTDLEYRQEVLLRLRDQVPVNVTQFFLTDFQEIKNQHYGEAIAPIISFVDEMQMVPVFSEPAKTVGLSELITRDFLTVFSLNRLQLGDKVVQTIAGLLFQQLFLVAQQRADNRHLIIIIDEVAVIEQPILARFLAELRKYRVSVVLAGQYFEQVSANLRAAILANVTNYYLFRVSRMDATLLTQQLEIKAARDDKIEERPKLLTDLKLRECLVKVDAAGEPLPIFRARTPDFVCGEPIPAQAVPIKTAMNMHDAVLAAQFELDPEQDAAITVPFVITSRKKII